MAGFYLYISNTTSKEDGYLCFHEIQNKTNTPLEDQRINCPVHGRYVIYYNERRPGVVYPSFYSQFAYIGLCEVEVYGRLNTFNECVKSGYIYALIGATIYSTCKVFVYTIKNFSPVK